MPSVRASAGNVRSYVRRKGRLENSGEAVTSNVSAKKLSDNCRLKFIAPREGMSYEVGVR
jgi:hypothetical protein